MFCYKCGTQHPDGAQVCSKCGTPLVGAVQPAPQPVQQPAPQPLPQPAFPGQPIPMLVPTLPTISGRNLQPVGVVTGSVSVNLRPSGIVSNPSEVPANSEATLRGRAHAKQIMIQEACALGAHAIVDVKYETSSVMTYSALDILVYGTAVRFI